MAYVPDVLTEKVVPRPDQIALARYVLEDSYITRYLSRVVKDKALAVYHVLFQLSWFETGKGDIVVPWASVGAFIRSEQGNIIDDSTTVKRRLPDLFEKKCITVTAQRGGANAVVVHLPSDIPACRALMERDELELQRALEAAAADTSALTGWF